MSEHNEPITSAADPLDAIIAEYAQQVEAGQVPDREALLADHPSWPSGFVPSGPEDDLQGRVG